MELGKMPSGMSIGGPKRCQSPPSGATSAMILKLESHCMRKRSGSGNWLAADTNSSCVVPSILFRYLNTTLPPGSTANIANDEFGSALGRIIRPAWGTQSGPEQPEGSRLLIVTSIKFAALNSDGGTAANCAVRRVWAK